MDINEVLDASKQLKSFILEGSVLLLDNTLSFIYTNIPGYPEPYYVRENQEKKEVYLIIKQDEPALLGSCRYQKEIDLPEWAEKVKVSYLGLNLNNLTDEQYLKHFFPKLREDNL
jgi:hypothetical protein|tara:strand:+ start:1603 stop:1947 length:345 start_codon:yes stop_codon:yes gene_type:complete